MLLGSMKFNAILLEPNAYSQNTGSDEKAGFDALDRARRNETLKLWGLSLGMTLDFIAYMQPSTPFSEDYPHDEVTGMGTSIAPSMT